MFLETFLQDLRIGLRVLIKEKSFCALAVFVLAIGIAAVATQFSVVNGVMLRGFTFHDADRLVDVQIADPDELHAEQLQLARHHRRLRRPARPGEVLRELRRLPRGLNGQPHLERPAEAPAGRLHHP